VTDLNPDFPVALVVLALRHARKNDRALSATSPT
jgi:hypothetical protein